MNIQKRLFRRPFTTIIWSVLLIAMALLIGVSGALYYSALKMPALLDEQHSTIATHKDKRLFTPGEDQNTTTSHVVLLDEDLEYLSSMEQVEFVDMRTLTGMYSPQLTPALNLVKWADVALNEKEQFANGSYDEVVLTGTIRDIWTDTDTEKYHSYDDLSILGMDEKTPGAVWTAVLDIDKVLAAHSDYLFFSNEDFSRYNGSCLISCILADGLEYFPEVGQEIIVSGMWEQFVGASASEIPYQYIDLPTLDINDRTVQGALADESGVYYYRDVDYRIKSAWLEDGSYESTCVWMAVDGRFPAMEVLDCPVEEFLAKEENQDWQDAVSYWQDAAHSMPVLGTQMLESMFCFVTSRGSIVDGRTFTQEEYDTGAKVCVISETVALNSGVKVGDTISVSQFLCKAGMDGHNYVVEPEYQEGMLNNPGLGYFPRYGDYVTTDETFTIVGLYRLDNEWDSTSYSITPNTVFIPQSAQIEGGFGGAGHFVPGSDGEEVYVPGGCHGVFLTVWLKNGSIDEFLAALEDSKYADRFLTFDTGYAEAEMSVLAVAESAEDLLIIAMAGWILLLLLYVLLYQGHQRRNLGIMRALGAKPGQARRYLFVSGMIPAVLGMAVGSGCSGYVLELVQDKLLGITMTYSDITSHSGGQALSQEVLGQMLRQSRMPAEGLLALALAQIVIIAVILWIHAALTARQKPRKLLRA